MPRKQRYFKNKEEDKFETEAFQFLNEDKKEDTKSDSDSGSASDQSGHDDDSDGEELKGNASSDSDEEAPDDIGFQDSRQSVLSQLRSAMRQVEEEKQKKKEKRKQLDTQFKEQKAKKQEQLNNSKLPEDFLESIDDVIPKKKTKLEKQTKHQKKKQQNITTEKKLDELELQKDDILRDDFIALTDSTSGVKVTQIKKLDEQNMSNAQIAADFRQSRLYGKNVKRESNQQRLAKKEKKRQRLR